MSEQKHRLVGNAAALMVATVSTSALGLVFWAVAARLYTAGQVGLGTAQISAATLAATAAQLSLGTLFLRYLPKAGKYAPWIVRRVFGVVIGVSVLMALAIVLLGFADLYLVDLTAAIVFVVAVPFLALFVVQDSALLGLGAAKVIPVENMLFAVGKLLLLPVFAVSAAYVGIFVSWVIPAVLAVIGIAIYLSRTRLSSSALGEQGTPLPDRKVLYPMVGKQYVGTLVSQLVFLGVPLIIIHRLGADENGYLSIAWMVGGAFNALTANITQSFSNEVRSGQHVTVDLFKRLVLLLAVVAGLGGLACAALAPIVLRILAPEFADESTNLLRLIGLSAPFQAVVLLMVTFWWLEGRFGLFALIQGLNAGIALALTWWLAPDLSLNSAGIALLSTSVVFAAGCAWPLARRVMIIRRDEGHIWLPEHADAAAGQQPPAAETP